MEKAYLDENTVYYFGNNTYGQLGLGNSGYGTERDKPEKIVSLKVGINSKFFSCEQSHTILIDEENNVYSFVLNNFGQLGLGDNINRERQEKIVSLKVGIK